MKLQGKVRRILAMLLVLIFAMSNIGLAEMDVQLDELFETVGEEPEVVEEPAAEVEAEAEPAEAEEAPEAEVAEEVAEVEAAEPVLKNLGVVAIDECTLIAEAEVENYEGELAWQWQSAAPAEEPEYVDIEGATGAELNLTDDARYESIYRCVVAAGDVSAATDAASFPVAEPEIAEEVVEAPAEETEVGSEEAAEAPAEEVAPELFAEIAEEPVEEHPVFVEETTEAKTFGEASEEQPEKVEAEQVGSAKTCEGEALHTFDLPVKKSELGGLQITDADKKHVYLCSVCRKYYTVKDPGEDSACSYPMPEGNIEEGHNPTNDDTCELCGEKYSSEFTSLTQIKDDPDQHWKECPVCHGTTAKEAHSYGESISTTKEEHRTDTCSCGHEVTVTEDDWELKPAKDGAQTGHKWTCKICKNQTTDDAVIAHTLGDDGTCGACGYAMGKIELSETEKTLTVGDKFAPSIKSVKDDVAGYTFGGFSYALVPADSDVVTTVGDFADSGNVTAAKAGTVDIVVSATYNRDAKEGGVASYAVSATCKLTVENEVKSVTLDQTKVTIYADAIDASKSVTLTATPDVTENLNDDSKTVTWTAGEGSSDMVDIQQLENSYQAKVTAKSGQSGKETVKVTINGHEATCEVTVVAKPTVEGVISFEDPAPASDTFTAKETPKVKFTYPEGFEDRHAEPKLELVDAEGKADDYVTLGADGTLTPNVAKNADFGSTGKKFKLSVKFNDYEDLTAVKNFTIKAAPTALAIQKDGGTTIPDNAITLYPTQTLDLKAVVTDDTNVTTATNVKWASDNENVTVDKDTGETTKVTVAEAATGTAKITATAGGETAELVVTVQPLPTISFEVTIDGKKVDKLGVGETAVIKTTVEPKEYLDETHTVTFNFGSNIEEVTEAQAPAADKLNPTIKGTNANASAEIKATLTKPAGVSKEISATVTLPVLNAPVSAADMNVTVQKGGQDVTELAVGETATVTFAYKDAQTGGSTYTPDVEMKTADNPGEVTPLAPATEADTYTLTAVKPGKVTVQMKAWNYDAADETKKLLVGTKEITVKPEIAHIEAPAILSKALTMGVGETIKIEDEDVKLYTAYTSAVVNTPASAADGYTWKLVANKPSYVKVTEVDGGWEINAVQATRSNTGATVQIAPATGGGKALSAIGVTVNSAPTGISLSADATKLLADEKETATLTAKLAGSKVSGQVSYDYTYETLTAEDVTKTETDNTVKLTAKKAGKVTVVAKVYNSKFEPDDMPSEKAYLYSEPVTVEFSTPVGKDDRGTVKFEGDVTKIGYGASIGVTAEFEGKLGTVTKWAVEPEGAAKFTNSVRNTATMTIDSNFKGGDVTITATVETKPAEGDAAAETATATGKIKVLTPIEELGINNNGVAVAAKTVNLAKSETAVLVLTAIKGHATGAEAGTPDADVSLKGLISAKASKKNYVKLSENADGSWNVRGLKQGTVTVTFTAKGGTNAKVTVKISKNAVKELKLTPATDIKAAKGEDTPLTVSYGKTGVTPNLYVKTEYLTGTDTKCEQISWSNNKIHVTDDATAGDTYKLTFSVGYTDSATAETKKFEKSCTVTITDKIDETNQDKLTVKIAKSKGAFVDADGKDKEELELKANAALDEIKLGLREPIVLTPSFETGYSDTLKVTTTSKGVTIKDNAGVYTVTPTKSGKKTIKIATGGGVTLNLTLRVATAKSSVALSPSASSVNLGEGESYIVRVATSRGKGEGKWFDATETSANLTVAELEDSDPDYKEGYYSYKLTANEASGKKSFKIDGYSGSKSVTVNLKPGIEAISIVEPNSNGDDFEEASEFTIAKGETLTVKADTAGGVGELAWTVDDTKITATKAKSAKSVGTGLKAYKPSNDTLMIVSTSSAKPETTLNIKVATTRYSSEKSQTATVNVVDHKYGSKDFDHVELERNLVMAGQKTSATLIFAEGVEPQGAIKWSVKPTSCASIDGNGMITTKKAGNVTVTAESYNKVGKGSKAKTVKKTATLYVVGAPTSLKGTLPKTLYLGEEVTVPVTVAQPKLAKKQTLAKGMSTKNAALIDTAFDEGNILVTDSTGAAVDDITVAVEDATDANPLVKNVTLSAKQPASGIEAGDVLNLTITTFSGKVKLSGKITIVNKPTKMELSGETIVLAPGNTLQLTPKFYNGEEETSTSANVSWKLRNGSDEGITISNGKITIANKAADGATAWIDATATATDEDGNPLTASCKVEVKKIPTADDIKVKLSKTKLVKGEYLYATTVGDYDGAVTWSTDNKSRLQVVDAKKGIFKAKASSKSAHVIATLNYKNSTGKTKTVSTSKKANAVSFASAPTTLKFATLETGVVAGGSLTLTAAKPSSGVTVAEGEKETLYSFHVTKDDDKIIEKIDSATGLVNIASGAVNGQTAEIGLYLFEAQASSKLMSSITLTVIAEPYSIKIGWKDFDDLSKQGVLAIDEGAHMSPYAIIKDAEQKEIPNVKVDWTVEGNDGNVTINPQTGRIEAKKYTAKDASLTVKATISGATGKEASFQLKINPTRKAEYILTKNLKTSIAKGETIAVTAEFDDAVKESNIFEGYTLNIESKDEKTVKVEKAKEPENTWNLTGVGSNRNTKTATIVISATKGEDVLSREVKVTVVDAATGLTATPSTTEPVAIGESITVKAALEGYRGTVNATTFKLEADETNASKLDITKGADFATFTVKAKDTSDAFDATLTLTSPVFEAEQPVTVKVSFKKAPTAITIKPDGAIAISQNEAVELTADFGDADAIWTQGVSWKLDEAATKAGVLLTVADDTMSAKVDTNGADAVAKITVTATLNGDDTKTDTQDITVKPAPTAETVKDIIQAYSFGKNKLTVGEKTTVALSFQDGKECTYSWAIECEPEGCATIDPKTGEVSAVAAGKATVWAVAYNDVALTCEGSVLTQPQEITITEAPDGVELRDVKDVALKSTFTIKPGESMTVKAQAYKLGEDGAKTPVSAACTLTTASDALVVPETPTAENTWTVKGGEKEGVALLTVKAGEHSKQYVVKVSGETVTETDLTLTVAAATAEDYTTLTGDALADANYNMNVSKIAGEGGNYTITAPVENLKKFKLTEKGEAKAYVAVKLSAESVLTTPKLNDVDISGGEKPEFVTDYSASEKTSFVLWIDAEALESATYTARVTADTNKVANLSFALQGVKLDPLSIKVTKLDAEANCPTDPTFNGVADSFKANQNAITVTQDGDTITVTADCDALKAYTHTDSDKSGDGAKKWIGFAWETGLGDIKAVAVNGKAWVADDVTKADSVTLPNGTAVMWMQVDVLYEEDKVFTLTRTDGSKLPQTLTFHFVNQGLRNKLELSPATAADDVKMMGKTAEALQSGVTIKGDKVEGLLHYVADYAGYSKTVENTKGHYLALHTHLESGVMAKVEVTGGEGQHDEAKDIPTGDDVLIVKITNASEEKIKFTIQQGESKVERELTLAGLTTDNLGILSADTNTGYDGQAKVSNLWTNPSFSYDAATKTYSIGGDFELIKTWTELSKDVPAGGSFYFPVAIAAGKSATWKTADEGGEFQEDSDTNVVKGQDAKHTVLNVGAKRRFQCTIEEDTITLDFTKANLKVDWDTAFQMKAADGETEVATTKKAKELQSNIKIEGNAITGMLHYTKNLTGTSYKIEATEGYYLVLTPMIEEGTTGKYWQPGTEAETKKANDLTHESSTIVVRVEEGKTSTLTIELTKCGVKKTYVYDLSGLTFAPVYLTPESDETQTYFEKKVKDLWSEMAYTVAKNDAGEYVFTVTGKSKKQQLNGEQLPQAAKDADQYFAAFSFEPDKIKDKGMHMTKGPTKDNLNVDENTSPKCGDDECDWLLNITTNKVFKFVIDEGTETEQTYILDFTAVECPAE